MENLKIAFFGSSLVSAYWNGAATYYRGMIKALHALGHDITFYEPDAFERQAHRDIEDPEWAKVVVYEARKNKVYEMLRQAQNADIIIKASGVGVFDSLLETELALLTSRKEQLKIFWDVDAPATLSRMEQDSADYFRNYLPAYDMVLTYGGGEPVQERYAALGAQFCQPVYNALDPDTHFPTEPQERFECDLAFLGNRLPDREKRVEDFFLKAAESLPDQKFVIGGSGWHDKKMPNNVKNVGHVYTRDHNAFNCTPKMVLNISRDSMAQNGFSPATRVFEAAGAGACLITDKWKGIEQFLEPGKEVLVADSGAEVADFVKNISPEDAESIGKAALKRVRNEHTYKHRAKEVQKLFAEHMNLNKTMV